MSTKAPAKKTTTKAETKAPAAKAAPQKNDAANAHSHSKQKDECCGGSCGCSSEKDELHHAMHDELEHSGCCGGHEHVHKTTIKPKKKNTSGIVEDGNQVSIHYTGSLDSGEVFDSSVGREPIEFVLGSHSVIPGFEKAILGMKKGEKKKVVIESMDAYGDQNPELMQEVPKEALGDITPEEGMMLALHHPMSPQPIPVRIAKVGPQTVTIDMNHPLAGKRLHFELEIVDIK